MKSDYTLLATEREPIVYVEHAKVVLDDGMLTVLNPEKVVSQIPALTTFLLFIGAGSSITQEAAIFCAQNNVFICMGRGGSFIHSVWQGGRWQDPQKLVKQVQAHSDPEKRLEVAKTLIKLKVLKNHAPQNEVEKIKEITSIESLMAFEAYMAKAKYKEFGDTYCEEVFRRDQKSREGVNATVTLLSNALYSYTTALIIQFGLHPSVGFLHGQTRRGGLSFDLADIFKHDLVLYPAFAKRELTSKETIMYFANEIKAKRFRFVKEMIHVMRYICGEIDSSKVEDILNEHCSF